LDGFGQEKIWLQLHKIGNNYTKLAVTVPVLYGCGTRVLTFKTGAQIKVPETPK
jgi:hypothetical protein